MELYMSEQVRVRFAPSPTGSLHLGGVRTALYNYLLAKHYNGQFIIRIEDTDLERNQVGAETNQLKDLTWLGLDWDEGPEKGGNLGPYFQSQRGEIYQDIAQKLLTSGQAFYCFLTDEEIEALHSHENRQLKSPYRDMPLQEALIKVENGETYVIRFKNTYEAESFQFTDLVHGDTTLAGNMVGDFVLIRSNQQPVYNFCCAVDDHLMEISHVLRGEEHLSNTLRQLMVYRALDWQPPLFGHLSMILGENRKKLSKRDDAVAMQDFISGGYLPEAILNYVALLGWSHEDSEEKFYLPEMIKAFSIERVNKSPAMFDRDKLNWLNHYHLNQKSSADILPYLEAIDAKAVLKDAEWFERFWSLIGHQFHTLVEVQDTLGLFESLTIRDKELLLGEGKTVVAAFKDLLVSTDTMNAEAFNTLVSEVGANLGVKGKRLFAPIRVALIGLQSGMELKVLAELMSKDEMLERINQSLAAVE